MIGVMISMKKTDNSLKDLTEKFDSLIKEEKLNINTIEDIMIESIENYKKKIEAHIEELLKNHINEKELISKKNKNGKKKDIN